MTEQSPISSPSGYSDAMKLAALELRSRLQAGETVPLEDLRKFILSAEENLRANRVPEKKTKTPPPQDVDFF